MSLPTPTRPAAPISRALVVLLAVACGLSVANLYYAQPILATLARTFGVSSQDAGLIVTLSQAGYAVGLALLVPLGDLVHRRRIIPVILTLTSAALLASAIAPSIAVLAGVAVLVGAGSVVAQMLVPLAASLASDEQRGGVVGLVMSGLLLGILLARTASGLIAGAAGWRSVYITAAALTLALAVVLRRRLPDEVERPRIGYRALLASTTRLIVSEPALRRRAIYGALGFAAFSVFWTTIAFLLAGAPYHYGEATIGLFGLVGAAGALCASAAGRWADRGGTRASTLLFAGLIAASFVVLSAGRHSLAALIAGIVILDLGVQGLHVTNQSIIYAIAPALRSRINSVYMVCYFAGGALGSSLGSHIYTGHQWPGVCELGALIGAIAVVGALVDLLRSRGALYQKTADSSRSSASS
jgi:predicted MFS family arabinose efflux permease